MDNALLEQLKFPVGKCPEFKDINSQSLEDWMAEIADFPKKIRALTEDLSEIEKQWVYRPLGWNIAQVVHHCADSHMNSFVRFKWALTEDKPTIKAYFEDRWAELSVSKDLDIADSLDFIEILHHRWVKLLRTLSKSDLQLQFVHPESGQEISLAQNIGVYAWHCRHHLAHLKQALNHKGKF